MKYLLDTCMLSELIKKNPSQKVTRWLSKNDEIDLFISVLTIGEIHKGIEKLPESKRKEKLHQWVNTDLIERFKGRIIDFDSKTATVWGKIQAHSELSGRAMPAIDGQIVATGISFDLTVATRNTSDTEISGAALFNPWE